MISSKNSSSPRALRLIYSAGPGDVIGTYRHWKLGEDDPAQLSMTYSGMFYELCRDLGAKAWIISRHPRNELVQEADFRIEHRPVYCSDGSSMLFLLEQFWWGVRFVVSALLFRADAAVVSTPSFDPIPLRILPWLGVKLIPTVHCVLWPKNRRPTGRRWMRRRIQEGYLYGKSASMILSVSGDISRQIEEVAGGASAKVLEFFPSYRRETFADAINPPVQRLPFRVLFVGRIEEDKGVFDLLQIAQRFNREHPGEFQFDLCGTGSALHDLRRKSEEAGLEGNFRCHGHCDRPTMRQMFGQCHVVIVPTTMDFVEGFNKVVVEGVLARRPVITSSVCPALEYVRDAVMEVPPNDVNAYAEAILRLRDDLGLYEKLLKAGLAAGDQFYDPSRNWAFNLKKILCSTLNLQAQNS
jgi:glycosyltransferase involved in cell wall biosynthesis